ncbi:MAG: hydrogenase, membrane subunit 3-like protein (EchB-like) [uncultured bacterium]|uniref:Formate hydrogenlyase n=1 Tax=Candidatus Magasanikbacteria bacterium RIFOXYD2_FULL_36_9 TaxID=1798707 RepID=A0A1F6NYW8_9BACT|nr:MAG: hydrogenase, membrane subunit 3-like protein (EchB-like) [uncultured bacterium]OGH89109.1 MAG: hypothetical protein A2537_00360 [Candidatus Magasanikbacteria bacterium RIFOXYD2_FULL_36_9]
MSSIFAWTIQIILIPAISPFFIGVTRKIKAKFQNRKGASIFQPYRDLWKLFHKDEIISKDASWIFRFSPYIILALTIIVGACIPLISLITKNNYLGDFLVIVYLLALGTFFLALSGMDTGGGFGGFGSSREMTVAALTEGGLICSLLTLSLASHTTNLFGIANFGLSMPLQYLPSIILAFFSFGISLLAETARFPFDNPATHLELTMIHEAMLLEHSGKGLAMMEWAAANKFVIFLALAANLFFPFGIATDISVASLLVALLVLVVKISILCFGIAVLESFTAKLRFFRLPDLLFTSFVLSAIAIGLIF